MEPEQYPELPIVGVLPSHWRTVKFASVLDGGTRNGIYKPKEFHGVGDKIVNMGELFAYPRLHDVPMKRVRLSDSEQARFRLAPGDLLFARRSLVAEGAGKCSLVCEVSEPTTFESSIIRARPNPLLADSMYLYYLFQSSYGAYILDTIRRQVAVAGITGKDLEELPIPLPPLSEQQAIAYILGSLDDKIELNRCMNEMLEAIARALFKSWFVDFDPVRARAEGRQPAGMDVETAALFPKGFEESVLGEIPRGWRAGSLGEVADITMGQSPPGETYNEAGDGLPFYQGTRDFGFRFPSRRVYCTAPTRLGEKGDVLLSVRAPVGNLNMAIEQCAIGRGVAALRPQIHPGGFLYYLLQSTQPGWAKFEAEGTVFGSVSKSDVHNFQIIVPPLSLMQQFSLYVAPMDARIESNEAETHLLSSIRDALLPRLLSGEIRVKEAEKLVEAKI